MVYMAFRSARTGSAWVVLLSFTHYNKVLPPGWKLLLISVPSVLHKDSCHTALSQMCYTHF